MLKDITLGQYFPGNSVVHRLDPRTKLIMLVIYIVALFCAVNWVSYAIVFAFLAVTVAISKIPLKSLARGMKPLVMVLVFTSGGFLDFYDLQRRHCAGNLYAHPHSDADLRYVFTDIYHISH